jgi:hypothetical protein
VLKAIFKPLLAYLLCVLIVVASVDRVPDPPVLKPHHDRAAKLCLGGQHPPAPGRNFIAEQTAFHSTVVTLVFAWEIPAEPAPQLLPAIFRHHASDSSPPASAA